MNKENEQLEVAFKVKELERLLSEGKISLEQYLYMKMKIEKIKSFEPKENSDVSLKPSKSTNPTIATQHESLNNTAKSDFLKTDVLIVFSPLLLLTGVSLMGSTYMSTLETHGLYTYPHFTSGLLLTAVGMFFLVGGLTMHVSMRKTKSSGQFILLEGIGVTFTIMG
ncbi:MAG: hypothetical protein ACQXXG_09690, partial [Candidatus Bathyarchaeia archaeon]